MSTCPICTTQFPNLESLNHHLDESHQNSYFSTFIHQTHQKITRAAQSLPTIPLSLRQLNLSTPTPINSNMEILRDIYGRTDQGFNVDDYISKDNWIAGDDAVCMHPTCSSPLGIIHGKVPSPPYPNSSRTAESIYNVRVVIQDADYCFAINIHRSK